MCGATLGAPDARLSWIESWKQSLGYRHNKLIHQASARFYSPENVPESGRLVDFSDVQAGLAHAWGVASSFVNQAAGILNDAEVAAIAGSFTSKPKSHLAMVVTGVEENFASPKPHYTWDQALETTEELAKMVTNMADDYQRNNPDSLVVVSTPAHLTPFLASEDVVLISTDSNVRSLLDLTMCREFTRAKMPSRKTMSLPSLLNYSQTRLVFSTQKIQLIVHSWRKW